MAHYPSSSMYRTEYVRRSLDFTPSSTQTAGTVRVISWREARSRRWRRDGGDVSNSPPNPDRSPSPGRITNEPVRHVRRNASFSLAPRRKRRDMANACLPLRNAGWVVRKKRNTHADVLRRIENIDRWRRDACAVRTRRTRDNTTIDSRDDDVVDEFVSPQMQQMQQQQPNRYPMERKEEFESLTRKVLVMSMYRQGLVHHMAMKELLREEQRREQDL